MPNCVSCKHWFDERPERDGTRCVRCGQDNDRWLTRNSSQFLVALPWGPLLLFTVVAPVFGLAVFLLIRQERAAQVMNAISSTAIGLVVGGVLCLVLMLLLFSVRDDLRLYHWNRKLPGARFTISLPVLASSVFTLALVLGMAYAFAYKAADVSEGPIVPLHWGARLFFTLALSLTFANLTLSGALMAAYEYTRYVNHLAPSPIFADEELLTRIVLRDARRLIFLANRREEDEMQDITPAADVPPDIEADDELAGSTAIELVGFARLPDGGIKATLQHVWQPVIEDGIERLLQQALWDLEADRWGRIRDMKRLTTRQRAAIGRLSLRSTAQKAA